MPQSLLDAPGPGLGSEGRIPPMTWGSLATQFCLELAFGVLFALFFVPRAPVGKLFYRMMGATAMLPVLAVFAMGAYPLATGSSRPLEGSSVALPIVVATGLALCGWPLLSGGVASRRWRPAMVWSTACTVVALVLAVRSSTTVEGPLAVALGTLSAMATGAVAGSVGLAMVLGHWYLTVPKLDVAHLARLNRVTVTSMVASLALLVVSCLAFTDVLNAARTPLLGPWGLFYLGTRVTVGLLVPLVFAWMTAGSLKFKNTRSATGILYASTILVLIGTAASVSLQDSYGVPL